MGGVKLKGGFKFIFILMLLIGSNITQADLVDRLNGIWEGEGKQSNTQTQWTIRFTASTGTYKIEYPSLLCNGTWTFKSQTSGSVTFLETIEVGTSRCIDQGTVELLWIEKNKLRFTYYFPNGHIGAFGELICSDCNINANNSFFKNGILNIPNVDVSDDITGIVTYEANLLLIPSSNPLRFELIDAHLK